MGIPLTTWTINGPYNIEYKGPSPPPALPTFPNLKQVFENKDRLNA